MTINEIGFWVFIAVVSLAFIEHRLSSLSEAVSRLDNRISSMSMISSTIDRKSDALRRVIDDVSSKVEGLSIAIYGVSDKLDQATTQIDTDIDNQLSAGDSLHERLDHIERLIHNLTDELNSEHREVD